MNEWWMNAERKKVRNIFFLISSKRDNVKKRFLKVLRIKKKKLIIVCQELIETLKDSLF